MKILIFDEVSRNKKSTILTINEVTSFTLQSWVNDSDLSKVISQFRSSNARLGNRAPLQNGRQYKICRICETETSRFKNNEVHILTECSELELIRAQTGISNYVNAMRKLKHGKSNIFIARCFLGHDGAQKDEMMIRAKALTLLKLNWETKMKQFL